MIKRWLYVILPLIISSCAEDPELGTPQSQNRSYFGAENDELNGGIERALMEGTGFVPMTGNSFNFTSLDGGQNGSTIVFRIENYRDEVPISFCELESESGAIRASGYRDLGDGTFLVAQFGWVSISFDGEEPDIIVIASVYVLDSLGGIQRILASSQQDPNDSNVTSVISNSYIYANECYFDEVFEAYDCDILFEQSSSPIFEMSVIGGC